MLKSLTIPTNAVNADMTMLMIASLHMGSVWCVFLGKKTEANSSHRPAILSRAGSRIPVSNADCYVRTLISKWQETIEWHMKLT